MRKKILLTTGAVIMLSMSACSAGVPQQDYESVSQENESLKSEQADQNTKYEVLSSQYDSMNADFDAYKESMSAYEGLSAAEAQARKIEADAVAASKAAEEEAAAASKAAEEEAAAASKAAEEEAAAAATAAAQAAQEKIGYNTGITYNQLARTPDDFKDQKVKFSGKVLQVVEGTDDVNHIRLAVNNDYNKILYCEYSKNIVGSRILEDDKITVYGTSYGLYSYTSTMGGVITIPAVIVDKIDQ